MHGRVVPGPPGVGEALRSALGEEVPAVADREGREVVEDLLPAGLAGEPQALAPALGGLEAPAPVRELEGRVVRAVLREDLLRALEDRPQHVAPFRLVPRGERRHELRRLVHDVFESLEGGAVAALPVDELGVVDRVRLLPHEERADARRRLRAARARHLRPAGPGVALAPRGLPRTREDVRVVPEAPLQEREAPPEGEVRGVPPVHLEVELAFPAVEGEPGLLRRVAAGALDRGEVLGEHDASLQLAPAGIAAPREVDRPAGRPEAVPVLLRGPTRLREPGRIFRRRG